MSRRKREMEDGREVCLEEEVERLRRSGMSVAEISRTMGVDQSWVEDLVVRLSEDPGANETQVNRAKGDRRCDPGIPY